MIYNPQPQGALSQFKTILNLERYVTEGADAFNAALQDAQPGWGIYIPAGVWDINPFVIGQSKTGIGIFGAGRSSILRCVTGTTGSFARSFADYAVMRDFVLDANNDPTTYVGSNEGLDLDASDCFLQNVGVINAQADGFDLDNAERNIITGCYAADIGKALFHCSNNARDNRLIGNFGARGQQGTNARGGMTQVNGAERNVYIGNTIRDCYRNYDIDVNPETIVFHGNISIGGEVSDNISGVNTNPQLIVIP